MSESNPLRQLAAVGQSIWYDNIHRGLLGAPLAALIRDDGLRGITSNPAIFEKAIASGDVYDKQLSELLATDPEASPRELFFALATQDIQAAADQLRDVYESSNRIDGMVSLEVSPDLADDATATIDEARQLHARLARPNVLIKVPATLAGLDAIEQLTADGISVNVTLLFSVKRYEQVAEAFLHGLERRKREDLSIDSIVSVASFFVSRVDAALDPRLVELESPLAGKIAIANAKAAYRSYQSLFSGERWQALADWGASPQRLLWASTSSKNPANPPLIYVESLVGPDTVNTLPPAVFDLVRAGAVVDPSQITNGSHTALTQLEQLSGLGIDLEDIATTLERDGVAAFATAFENLLSIIAARSAQLAA